MSSQNVVIRQYDGTQYVDIFPKTISAQISDLASTVASFGYTKVQYGSYTGTGTYGSSDPNSLTFNFTPVIVIISAQDMSDYAKVAAVFINGVRSVTTYLDDHGFGDSQQVRATWNSNIISWYYSGTKAAEWAKGIQLNSKSTNYYYVALSF